MPVWKEKNPIDNKLKELSDKQAQMVQQMAELQRSIAHVETLPDPESHSTSTSLPHLKKKKQRQRPLGIEKHQARMLFVRWLMVLAVIICLLLLKMWD